LPGMYLTGMVETSGVLVPAVPDEAVIDFQGQKYLFVVTENTQANEGQAEAPDSTQVHGTHFEMVDVQIGHSELGYTEVILPEKFKRDSQVVMKGAYAILSKLKNSEDEGGHAH